MSGKFEYWIGRRYVRSRSSNGFISLISAISMLGIAIAVAVLIVVLSVVNGFERELNDRLLAMSAHASIENPEGGLTDWQVWADIAEAQPDVAAAAPYVERPGFADVRQSIKRRRVSRHRSGSWSRGCPVLEIR